MRAVLTIFFRAEDTRPWLVLFCLSSAGALGGVGWASLLPLLSVATGGLENDSSPLTNLVRGGFEAVGLTPEIDSLIVLVVGSIVLKCVVLMLAMRYVGYTVATVATRMRVRLIDRLLRARWSYFTRKPIGRIANAISNDATRAGDSYLQAATFLSHGAQTAAYIVVAVLVSWRLALLALCVGVAIAASLGVLVRIARKAGLRQTQRTSELVAHLSDALGNIKPLKAMARQDGFARLSEDRIAKLRNALRRQVVSKHALKNAQEILMSICIGIGFYLGLTVWEVAFAELLVIGLLMFQTILGVGRMQQQLQKTLLLESPYLSFQALIEEVEAAREPITGIRPAVFDEDCLLDGVSFAYGERQVLDGASMAVPARGVTVLTGPSGAGKTTVSDLILGLSWPDRGRVMLDGAPLEEIDLESWRSQIGYVPQEPILLNDTVRANVTLGDPAIGEDRIWQALRAAGADGFVRALEDGLDSLAGERGAMLSGGQRQRISLARALARRPRLLILDEATAGLDPATERGICATVAGLADEVAVLVITHGTAWAAYAERVYRFESGRIERADPLPRPAEAASIR